MIGWDHPATAERYERFCRRHARYRRANEELARAAEIAPAHRVLDLGAGTGRTADAVLRRLGPRGAVVCVEPAGAMREAGRRRVRDPRVRWRADLPPATDRFDRILAGAAIWQLDPIDDWLRRLARRLVPGGALAFDVPALYLGEPDEPGGGRDPSLLEVVGRLAAGAALPPEPPPSSTWRETAASLESRLRAAGLDPRGFSFRHRLGQAAHARWLAIPVLTDRLLAGLDPEERDRRIEAALAAADPGSFRWERWRGWVAWKR